MAECLLLKSGGGGADTSVVTAVAEDVVAPKVIVDANGNPVTGIIPARPQTVAGVASTLYNNSFYIRFPWGAYPNATIGGVSEISTAYVPQAEVASKIGLTGAKLIPGNTVLGVASTVTSMGAQTVNPGNTQKIVSCSGKYMTGNVTVPAVAGLIAANIKKGAVVGGVTGTYEGFRVYTNGRWGGWEHSFGESFSDSGGGLHLTGGKISYIYVDNIDFTKFNAINIEFTKGITTISGTSFTVEGFLCDVGQNSMSLKLFPAKSPAVTQFPYTMNAVFNDGARLDKKRLYLHITNPKTTELIISKIWFTEK